MHPGDKAVRKADSHDAGSAEWRQRVERLLGRERDFDVAQSKGVGRFLTGRFTTGRGPRDSSTDA